MIVYRVERQYIDAVFPHIQHLLQKAIETNVGEVLMEDVKQYLRCDQQQLWLGLNEKEKRIELAFTTQIVVYPNQKHLQIHLTGAEPHTLENWLDSWSEPLEKFCKENRIKYIECAGREGWTKILNKLGYRKYVTVLVKEL
jgi:hypothetical protein